MTDNTFKTSKRIRFATDNWGGQGITHLEIEWNNSTLMVDITEERIHIVGPMLVVTQTALNALDIEPKP